MLTESLKQVQEKALASHFGKVPGHIRFYDELSKDQLRLELEKRDMKDYPTDKVGSLAADSVWGSDDELTVAMTN